MDAIMETPLIKDELQQKAIELARGTEEQDRRHHRTGWHWQDPR